MTAVHDTSSLADERVLEGERALNARYLEELERQVARSREIAGRTSASESSRWTDSGPRTKVSHRIVTSLIGRLALDEEDADLGWGFYVGGLSGAQWSHGDEDLLVVSWATPVAKLFFEGRKASDVAASHVVGRRTFERSADERDLVAYEDTIERGARAEEVFRARTASSAAVPAPPTIVRPARRSQPAPPRPVPVDGVERRPSSPAMPSRTPTGRQGDPPSQASDPRIRREPKLDVEPLERVPSLVRRAIEAPRTGALRSVLSTLQSSQYRLVTFPDDRSLVVDGPPGTGKTIIATHRAAYLVHKGRDEEVDRSRQSRSLGRVALVGPTEAWSAHVRQSVDGLGGDRVEVIDLHTFLSRASGLDWKQMDERRDGRLDATRALGSYLTACVAELRRAGRATSVSAAWKAATSDRALRSLADDEDVRDWIDRAPNWETARGDRRNLPAFAVLGAALRRAEQQRWDHLLVDEAQDLRPLEWDLLLANLRPGGSVTLVGDLNQRRSDWTAGSWDDLAADLDITDSDGRIHVERLSTGFRSTRRILKFANQLLPKNERAAEALREGTDPTVERVAEAELVEKVSMRAVELSRNHPDGQVAVITTVPTPISNRFRQLGWARPSGKRHAWAEGPSTVWVLSPGLARGLEFDGVVVVEPLQFPENLGRAGVLYTSLTRATKELVVVHSRGLPRGLRAR